MHGAEAEDWTEAEVVGAGGGCIGGSCCYMRAVEVTPEACCSWQVPRAAWNWPIASAGTTMAMRSRPTTCAVSDSEEQ